MALRWTPSRQHIHLVVTIEVDFVIAIAELLALSKISRDIALVPGSGNESRKPVEPGNNAILDLAGRHSGRLMRRLKLIASFLFFQRIRNLPRTDSLRVPVDDLLYCYSLIEALVSVSSQTHFSPSGYFRPSEIRKL
jgi:hypothetical protein